MHAGQGGYSSTSLPHMVCILQMKQNKEEVEALEKEFEAIDKNASRGFEEKKQST